MIKPMNFIAKSRLRQTLKKGNRVLKPLKRASGYPSSIFNQNNYRVYLTRKETDRLIRLEQVGRKTETTREQKEEIVRLRAKVAKAIKAGLNTKA